MKQHPLPFDLPPPDRTPPEQRPKPQPPRADRPSPTPEHVTDLPLSLRGNGGNGSPADQADMQTIDRLLDRLDRLLRVPAAPPLTDADPRAVLRWVEAAAAGLAMRRKGLELIRLVEARLAEASATARSIEVEQERLDAKRRAAEERAAGAYWRRRDAGRRAQRPTQVLVHASAWDDMKTRAARDGRTVGEVVGELVARSVAAGSIPTRDATSTSATFARLVVDDETWAAFAAMCRSVPVPIRRAVGLLVELRCPDQRVQRGADRHTAPR
jgi:hypothetical protein